MDGDWEKSKEDETLLQNDHNEQFEFTRNSLGNLQKALDITMEYLASKKKCKNSNIRDTNMSRNTRDGDTENKCDMFGKTFAKKCNLTRPINEMHNKN